MVRETLEEREVRARSLHALAGALARRGAWGTS